MAINIRERLTLGQAKAQRLQMPRYLQLDGGRYLIAAALLVSLISLLTLGQTGRLATKGFEIADLQRQRTELLRERSGLQIQLVEAQSIVDVEQRARKEKLRPMTPDQVRYITVPPLGTAPQPTPIPTPAP